MRCRAPIQRLHRADCERAADAETNPTDEVVTLVDDHRAENSSEVLDSSLTKWSEIISATGHKDILPIHTPGQFAQDLGDLFVLRDQECVDAVILEILNPKLLLASVILILRQCSGG